MKYLKINLEGKKNHRFSSIEKIYSVTVKDANFTTIYHRDFLKAKQKINFNLPKTGEYYILPTHLKFEESKAITGIKNQNKLRSIKPVDVIYNPALQSTPARMFRKDRVIELSRTFENLKPHQKVFILMHELAHFHKTDEAETDALAMCWYIAAGYNYSQAIDTLQNILKLSNQKAQRIANLYRKSHKI